MARTGRGSNFGAILCIAMHFTVDTYLSITGIILGLVALAMAVPPFIQMFFGAPQIIIRLDHRQLINPNGKSLQVHVTNDIISGKWLRRLRVMRQPTDILAYFSISEAAKVIVPWEGAKLRTEKEHGKQVTLSTLFPAIFSPVIWEDERARVNLDTDDGRGTVFLHSGQYLIVINIIYGHDKRVERQATFVVGDTMDRTYWAPGSLVRKQ